MVKFKYGDGSIGLDIPEKHILGIIEDKKDEHNKTYQPVQEMVKNTLFRPEGVSPLRQILKKNRPGYLIVIVSDISRNIRNYSEILDVLVAEIIEAGVKEENIEFIVALGTHRIHTQEEQKIIYGPLIDKFKFSFHDGHKNLKMVGKTSTGLEILINEKVTSADFVLTTGRINYHYLAGFSGGRKSILPGVSGYETIRKNHIKLLDASVQIGKLNGNIINLEMEEAARLVGVDFSLNVIEDHDGETIWMKAGQPEVVFKMGTDFFRNRYMFTIGKKADCIFVAGGKGDRDFFNAHKILNLAAGFVKPGGSIILIASAQAGMGNEKFTNYLTGNSLDDLLAFPIERIELGGHRAFVTARLLKMYKIYVYSSLNHDILRRLHFQPLTDLRLITKELKQSYSEHFTAYLNPQGYKFQAIGQNMCKKKLVENKPKFQKGA